MNGTYQPELWHDLFVMLGTSSAALIGLLFIVTSLHLEEVMNNPIYRNRARNTTLHLLALLVQASLILTPQPMAALGAELAVISGIGLWLPLSFAYLAWFKSRAVGQSGGFSIYRAGAYIAGYFMGIVGGVALIGGSSWGLYFVAAAFILFLVAIVMNAWTIMLGIGSKKPRRVEPKPNP